MTDVELDRELEDWIGAQVPVQAAESGAEEVLPAPDEDYADRLLYRARRLVVEGDRIRAHAARRIEEIQAWADDRLAGVVADQRRVRRSLEGFTRAYIAANPRRKSIPLVNGTLKLTAPGRGRIEVEDERALVAWAEENGRPDLLRYRPEPNKSALAELADMHPGPVRTIENADGEPERWETWHLLAEVSGDGDRAERATVPGVVFMRRAQDRFSVKTADDTSEESEA